MTRRETLSTEYLEQERKIAKEKLKLEAIRKEVIYIDGFEDVNVGYTNFTVLIGWIKYDLMHVVISNGKIKTLTNLLWTKLPSKSSLRVVLHRHCRCFSSIPTGRPEVC